MLSVLHGRRCSYSQFDPLVAEAFGSVDESTWHAIRQRVHRKVQDLGGHSSA